MEPELGSRIDPAVLIPTEFWSRDEFIADSTESCEGYCAGGAGLGLLRGRSMFAEGGAPVTLRLGAGAPVPIAEDFTGLGYEMSSVATVGLLSAANRRYVALVTVSAGRG